MPLGRQRLIFPLVFFLCCAARQPESLVRPVTTLEGIVLSNSLDISSIFIQLDNPGQSSVVQFTYQHTVYGLSIFFEDVFIPPELVGYTSVFDPAEFIFGFRTDNRSKSITFFLQENCDYVIITDPSFFGISIILTAMDPE